MAGKMSKAEKDAMLWVYSSKAKVKAPSERTLAKLFERGFIYEDGEGYLFVTAVGRNVARMIAREM